LLQPCTVNLAPYAFFIDISPQVLYTIRPITAVPEW
jgi:hypothetical protein